MASVPSQIIAESKPFKFIVGPDKKEFTIHSALVAQQSPVLQALVNDKRFEESTKSSVLWDDVEVEAFVSFWEFIYLKDYHLPQSFFATPEATSKEAVPEEMLPEEAVPESEPEPEPEPSEDAAPKGFSLEWAIPLSFAQKERMVKSQFRRTVTSWRDFRDSWRLELSDNSSNEPSEKAGLIPDYAAIFVHHARVYTLADRYGLSKLMKKSLLKLHQALMEVQLGRDRVNDVVVLLNYCYTEARPPMLRRLVVHYTACHIRMLWECGELQEMVEEHGALSRDLMEFLLLRLY